MAIESSIVEIIKNSKTIVIVGASRNPEKAAHAIPKYLQTQGYKIIPVNPTADEILGEKSLKSLKEVKQPVDIIDIFRPEEETPAIVKEAIKLKPKLIWLQLDIYNEKAKKIADEARIKFVMDHCLKVEHMKIMGTY
ncbi:MAG: CoA-binding protein [Asgard group archaeon]|nr:CoA-binding protein [Asgard group archaeon]